MDSAVGILLSLCFVIFIIVTVILQRVRDSDHVKANKYFGQIKIFVMFLQIVSAMPNCLDSVQWPTSFKLMAINLSFVNFEFMKLMDFSSCTLSLHPLNRFALHVSFVPLLLFAVSSAYITSMCIYVISSSSKGQKARIARHRQGVSLRIATVALLILYPGLGTRIFGIFRCTRIDSFQDQYWFQEDLSLKCYVTDEIHDQYLQLAIASVILIVIGTPFVIAVELFRNRKHLHNEKSSKHTDIKFKFGGLYMQYENEYWFFEIVVMLVKQIMTGALGILKPGTPIQAGLAVLTMFIYLMVLLRFTPFRSSADDMLAYISTLATLFIAMIGLFLKLDEQSEREERNFDPEIMGTLLVAITVVVTFLTILNLVLIKTSFWDQIAKRYLSSVQKGSRKGTSSLARQMSKTIHKAVVHHNANLVMENAAGHIDAHRKKVNNMMNKAKMKLQERLKRRSGGGDKLIVIESNKNRVLRIIPNSVDLKQTKSTTKLEIENVRSLLKKCCKSKNKFEKIFIKMDKDRSGTLNQKELLALIKICLAKHGKKDDFKKMIENVFEAVWVDICNNEDGVDCSSASEWIFHTS